MAARSVLLPLKDSDDISSDIRGHIALLEDQLSDLRAAGSLSESNEVSILFRIGVLKKCLSASEDGYEGVKRCFGEYSAGFDSKRRETVRHMDNMFRFCEAAFGEGQELLVLVTELAANPVTARFITCYGCEEYYRHDKSLMFYERRLEILHELEGLE